jgi:hypothetical protein
MSLNAKILVTGALAMLLTSSLVNAQQPSQEEASVIGESVSAVVANGEVGFAYMRLNEAYSPDRTAVGQYLAMTAPMIGREHEAIGLFEEMLASATSNGEAPRPPQVHEGYLRAFPANELIIEKARSHEILVINERHHVSRHRAFLEQLLPELFDEGYTVLSLEGVMQTGDNPRELSDIDHTAGFLLNDPAYANLARTMLQLGGRVFGHEALPAQNAAGTDRELAQATNVNTIRETVDGAKVIVLVGYAHASESPGLMAGHLSEISNVNPLTVDQHAGTPGSNENVDRPESNIWSELPVELRPTEPMIFLHENGGSFRGSAPGNYDLTVFHPMTATVMGRPGWYQQLADYRRIEVPFDLSINPGPIVVEARYRGDTTSIVPVDRVLVDEDNRPSLYLPDGEFNVIALYGGELLSSADVTVP